MKTLDNYASRQRKPTRYLQGMAMVVALHFLLFWAISSGLARAVVKKMQGPVEAVLLEEKQPDLPPPPPPPPLPKNLPPPPPAYVPPVDVAVSAPEPVNAIAAVTVTQAVQPSPVAPAAMVAAPEPKLEPAVRTVAVVNSANCEKPSYPSASLRLEEEGTVSLRFLVGTDGRVIQSAIEKSSGFRRLDEAARDGLSRCTFKPASVNGKPEQGWASLKYTWRLE